MLDGETEGQETEERQESASGEAQVSQQEHDQSQDEAAFAAGFSKVHGESEPTLGEHLRPGDEPTTGDRGGEQQAAEGDDQRGQESNNRSGGAENLEAMEKRLRRMEGRYGTLQKELRDMKQERDELKAERDKGGQSSHEREQTLRHLEQIEKSIEEFEELAPLRDELQDVTSRLHELESQKGPGSSPDDIDDRIDRAVLDATHGDWEKVTQSEEFRRFALNGGPSEQDYMRYATAYSDPETQDDALQMVQDWADDYPEWWDEKGQALFEGGVKESIYLLDRFKDAAEQSQQRRQDHTSRQQRRDKRLRSSAIPEGAGGSPSTGLSDEEAFGRGFNKAKRTYGA